MGILLLFQLKFSDHIWTGSYFSCTVFSCCAVPKTHQYRLCGGRLNRVCKTVPLLFYLSITILYSGVL